MKDFGDAKQEWFKTFPKLTTAVPELSRVLENIVHWVMDVCFREDQSRARAGCAAENLAPLRRLALNLLKLDQTKKLGIRDKQLNAG
jgi:predicted transposase YbfD/YdcC